MIFAGGSLPVSGITEVGPQVSFALCAKAVTEYTKMAATDSENVVFELAVYLSFAIVLAPYAFT